MAICAFTSSHRAEPSYPAPKPRQECLFARNSVLGQKIPEKKLSLPSKRPNQTMARVIFLTDFSEAYARELLLGMARYAHDTAQASQSPARVSGLSCTMPNGVVAPG